MITEEQIKYLCEVVRNDFDTSRLSKASLIERIETAMSMFARIGINNHDRVKELVSDMQSDLKTIELW